MDEALKEKKLLRSVVVQLGAALSALHLVAVIFQWYHTHPWIDIPQHFAGGVFAALFFYWLYYAHPRFFKLVPGTLAPLVIVLSWTAFLGVLFEFAEFAYDRIAIDYFSLAHRYTQLGLADTMGDLFFDMLGGLTLAIFMRLRYDKRKRRL